MSTLADYFRAIVDQEAIARLKDIQQEPELEDTVKVSGAPAIMDASAVKAVEKKDLKEKVSEPVNKTVLPKLKCQLSISNFRVAIIEDVYTQQPQALSLNVSLFPCLSALSYTHIWYIPYMVYSMLQCCTL